MKMEDFQINLFAFLGVLELAMVLLAVALFFVARSKYLARRVQALKRKLKEAEQDEPATVGFDQYLRDEVIRNQDLIDRAAASKDDAEKKAGELLRLRKQFLELEVEARALENNPVEFQDRLAAGMSELIEQLRPEPETVTETVSEATEPPSQAGDVGESNIEEGGKTRTLVDTHDAEVSHLKDVINNQQDAMEALRKELEARAGEIEDLDSILAKLDEFEKQSSELESCLKVLEQENERLKAARAAGENRDAETAAREPAQLRGLKSMMGQQQDTINNLQNLIRELAPEASKAKELQNSIDMIQRTNQELNGCVSVLEDENAMLRSELEEIQVQLDQQEQAERNQSEPAIESVPDEEEPADAEISAVEEMHEMEIKVQELEALVEFKDAAIEELEKQYNTLESKYLVLTGEKSAG
jgi:chromosome segregation ATPase